MIERGKESTCWRIDVEANVIFAEGLRRSSSGPARCRGLHGHGRVDGGVKVIAEYPDIPLNSPSYCRPETRANVGWHGGSVANWAPNSSIRAFSSEACPALGAGWIPVRVKKTRPKQKVEPRSDSIGTEKALIAPRVATGVRRGV